MAPDLPAKNTISVVYLMHQKSKTFTKFREYKVEAKKQLGVHIKELRSDWGNEYLSGEFKSYLTQERIVSQLSALEHPNKMELQKEEIEFFKI